MSQCALSEPAIEIAPARRPRPPARPRRLASSPRAPRASGRSWTALEAGYRHIDTAQGYGNEATVGAAVRASGIPREEIFVTTKFHPSRADAELEAERSIESLGLGYIDLYLVHDPRRDPTWAWPGMERALARGLTRSIGVSNFAPDELDAVLAVADVPPAVNQLQLSPFAYRRALVEACAERGIAVEAYSPLTRGRDLGRSGDRGHRRSASGARRRRSCCAGASSTASSCCRSRITASARSRTRRSSTSRSARTTSPSWDALDRTGGTDRAHEHPWW